MAVDHRLGFDGQGGALAKDKIRARLEGRRGDGGQDPAADPGPRM